MEPLRSEVDLLFGDEDLPDDPVRVVLGDDNGLYRRGLLTALEDEGDLEVVAEAGPGPDLVAAARALAPDVVLCSLTMPQYGGVETTYAITEIMPLVRVAVLTTDQDPPERLLAAVQAGALGEADKVSALDEAARVIRAVHNGWPVFEAPTWAALAPALKGWLAGIELSTVEQDLLAALARGETWDEAATASGIGVLSARNRVRNLLRRTRAAGGGGARQAALAAGLVAAG
jgi:DNA-binding NarL/FixJ family response regulator